LIGWAPPATSMIDSRRWPRPTGPSIQSPSPSGPRWRSTSRMRLRRASSTVSRGFRPTMPTIPHMARSRWLRGHFEGVDPDPAAAGRGILAARHLDGQVVRARQQAADAVDGGLPLGGGGVHVDVALGHAVEENGRDAGPRVARSDPGDAAADEIEIDL